MAEFQHPRLDRYRGFTPQQRVSPNISTGTSSSIIRKGSLLTQKHFPAVPFFSPLFGLGVRLCPLRIRAQDTKEERIEVSVPFLKKGKQNERFPCQSCACCLPGRGGVCFFSSRKAIENRRLARFCLGLMS